MNETYYEQKHRKWKALLTQDYELKMSSDLRTGIWIQEGVHSQIHLSPRLNTPSFKREDRIYSKTSGLYTYCQFCTVANSQRVLSDSVHHLKQR